ncbi:MAG: hypothetical protein ACRENE_19645, partial [Polyangiaceae bacterium]
MVFHELAFVGDAGPDREGKSGRVGLDALGQGIEEVLSGRKLGVGLAIDDHPEVSKSGHAG